MSALPLHAEHEIEGVSDVRTADLYRSAVRPSCRRFAATAQATRQLADELANPALAAAWADTVVRYWEDGLADGRIDPVRPLYLLDLEPAQGQLGQLLMQALDERLPGTTVAELDYRYVACYEEGGETAIRHRAGYAPRASQSRFNRANWRGAVGAALAFDEAEPVVVQAANPVVVLALGWLHRQPSELYGAHRGNWMAGQILEADATGDGLSGEALCCDWQMAGTELMEPPCQALAEHYVAQLPGAALLVPTAALATLDALKRFCGRAGYLLLAAARGVCTECELRAGMLWPTSAWIDEAALPPVNFHALTLHQQRAAAVVHERQLSDLGMVIHAAWWRPGAPSTQAAAEALWSRLDAHHPDDSEHLASCVEALAPVASPGVQLAWVRLSHYDPRILARIVSGWSDRPLHVSDGELAVWRTAISRVWRHYVPGIGDCMVDQCLGLAAMRVGLWDVASQVFRSILACRGEDVAAHYYLARCLSATGRSGDAIEHSARAAALDPDRRACVALHRVLRKRDACWRSLPWYREDLARDGGLSVEPLGRGHAHELLQHLRGDPYLSVMAQLPDLSDRAQVLAWIDGESLEPGRCSFAVVHSERGTVGVVSYVRSGSAGYFYFWIGAAVQGSGLGTRAARLLFAQAAAAGIADLFTSVYVDNGRSSRALIRIGFEPLDVASSEPEVLHFHKSIDGHKAPLADRVAQLADLCSAIDQPVFFD